MEVITWLNSNSGAITGIAAMITAVATIVLAIITWRYVHLTNHLLKTTTNTPKIAIFLGRENTGMGSDMLSVENIGTGPAYDIRFKTDLSFLIYGLNDPRKNTLGDVGFLRDGINYLPPGGKMLRSLSLSHRLDELKETPLNISVTYKDSDKNGYPDRFSLDFGEIINSSHDRSPLHDIRHTLRNIGQDLKRGQRSNR